VILTEWQSFRELPWMELAPLMRRPAWLFDARSVVDLAAALSAGLQVWRVGMG
jgi:UDPglucose 6-dehydrogenase